KIDGRCGAAFPEICMIGAASELSKADLHSAPDIERFGNVGRERTGGAKINKRCRRAGPQCGVDAESRKICDSHLLAVANAEGKCTRSAGRIQVDGRSGSAGPKHSVSVGVTDLLAVANCIGNRERISRWMKIDERRGGARPQCCVGDRDRRWEV